MWVIKNISNRSIGLVDVDNDYSELSLDKNEEIEISSLSRFNNLSHLLDPSLNLIKIREV